MLKVIREQVLGELAALAQTAQALRDCVSVLQQCRQRLNTMKDGPVLREAKEDLRRQTQHIKDLADQMQSLRAQAQNALDILMDCEHGLILMNDELQVGARQGSRHQQAISAPSIYQNQPLVTVPDDVFRFSHQVYPDWLSAAARTHFETLP